MQDIDSIRTILEDCATVARMIQADPRLAARTVALANSVLFNRSGRVITDVSGAVVRVGYSVVRSLATALVARKIAGAPTDPAHRQMASMLWEHTTRVAALSYLRARRVTRQDPDTAMFAGLVHEVGGFYLISRAGDFPGLLDGRLTSDWMGDGEDDVEINGDEGNTGKRSFESRIGRAILEALSVPATVVAAIEVLWHGYLTLPPETLSDTLLLANRLVEVTSPFDRSPGGDTRAASATIEMAVENETLLDILKEAAGKSMRWRRFCDVKRCAARVLHVRQVLVLDGDCDGLLFRQRACPFIHCGIGHGNRGERRCARTSRSSSASRGVRVPWPMADRAGAD